MDGGAANKYGIGLEHDAVGELRSCDGKTGTSLIVSRPSRPRKGRYVQSIAFALAMMMVAAAGLGVLSMVKNGPDKEKVALAVPLFMTHSPILIEGEAALTTANGVTGGDGTAGNPYVIQGWDINASGTTSAAMAGIAVSNITSHLVIRNVNVHSGGSDNIGIVVYNVTDCTVESCQSTDNLAGILAATCGHLVIRNNTVMKNAAEGILVTDTDHAWVSHNIAVEGAGIGIALMNSTASSVINNTMCYNAMAGLALEFCNGTLVLENDMENNSAGLMLIESNWSVVIYNKISQSLTYGLFMMGCHNNTLYDNTISYTSAGIGAFLMFNSNNVISGNNFLNNSMSPQALDDSDNNHWSFDYTYPPIGNYWSDYDGSDANHDGIGDTPYYIYDSVSVLTTNDSHPRMTPVTYDFVQTAFFTVTPATGTTSTSFTLNASLSWDADNLTSDLQVRWDFDGDGSWDTGWSTDKIIQHSYTQPGEYNVTMEVTDGVGHTSNMTWHIEVDQVVIPEFTTLLVPICAMIAIFLVIGELGRRR